MEETGTSDEEEGKQDQTYLVVLFVKEMDNTHVIPESHDVCLWKVGHGRHIYC